MGFPGRRINHLCVFTLRVLPSLALSPCFRAPFLSFSFYFSSVVVRSMAIICFDRKQFERKEFTGRSVDYLGSLEHCFWKDLPLLSFFSALNITKGNFHFYCASVAPEASEKSISKPWQIKLKVKVF